MFHFDVYISDLYKIGKIYTTPNKQNSTVYIEKSG